MTTAIATRLHCIFACLLLLACSNETNTGPKAGDTAGTDPLPQIEVAVPTDHRAQVDIKDVRPELQPIVPEIADQLPDLFCSPGHPTCLDDLTRGICNDSGADYKALPCDEGTVCDAGFCLEVICTPQATKGECASPTAAYVCSEKGTAWTAKQCDATLTCYEGQCVDWQCNPGTKMCKGMSAVQECLEDEEGNYKWQQVESCEEGLCKDGECISACDVDLKMNSYLGCDYWAVDLDNIEGGKNEPVAVVVSAPADGAAAGVTITNTFSGMELTSGELGGAPLLVQPGGVQVYMLPQYLDQDGSMLSNRSFRIDTTTPVTVHQFNPLTGEEIFTNDASLLLPAHAGGEEYVVMSWPLRSWGGTTLRSFVTIVATQELDTVVLVTPTSEVLSGPGVPSIPVGKIEQFVLKQGDVLNLENTGAEGDDLTGTLVLADKKVSVFGGHECANIHIPWDRCDHIEQQLFPVQAWGTSYVGDMFQPRNDMQKDTWRIVAGDDNVQITLDPPIAGPYSLNKGEWVQFDSEVSFVANGTGKFLLGHYLQSCNYPGYTVVCSDFSGQLGIGDPAFTLSVPVQQYLDHYVLLTPEDYDEDYINFISKPDTQITLDGQPLTDPKVPAGFGAWTVIQKQVSSGVHVVESDEPIGLTVYGYGCHVSYAYPGGLKLEAF